VRHDDLYSVPAGLPVPVDDGACNHLLGQRLPPIELRSTRGREVRLDLVPAPWTVVYCYPRTGVPDRDSPPGWDAIPGARGCTPQNCAFRDHYTQLQVLGAEVFGLSTQTTDYQQEMAERLQLPFEVLSDADLELTNALRLPTFTYGDWTLLRRMTLILREATIVKVFYPVFPPSADAGWVEAWLAERAQPAPPAPPA
jgi:peroxiredoxin